MASSSLNSRLNSDEDIISYLEENADAIAYFGYAYYVENQNVLTAAAIQNEAGDFVAPEAASVADGSYNPLARRIYMNLLNDPDALALTAPFVNYGLGPAGAVLVSQTGYVPVPEPDMVTATSRIGS